MASDLTRRDALKFAGSITLAAYRVTALPGGAVAPTATGYGTDPDLLKRSVTWAKTLTTSERAALESLCDIVLPADPPHPSAKEIAVHEFLDEWLSAPYPQMQADRKMILAGLGALEEAAGRQSAKPFAEMDASRQVEVFDRLCGNEATSGFARRLIELICAGYYTTREGHAAIGYVGNVAQESFAGPPAEVVRHLDRMLAALGS